TWERQLLPRSIGAADLTEPPLLDVALCRQTAIADQGLNTLADRFVIFSLGWKTAAHRFGNFHYRPRNLHPTFADNRKNGVINLSVRHKRQASAGGTKEE